MHEKSESPSQPRHELRGARKKRVHECPREGNVMSECYDMQHAGSHVMVITYINAMGEHVSVDDTKLYRINISRNSSLRKIKCF